MIVLITKRVKNIRWLLFLGALLSGLALVVMGPSLSLPNHLFFPFLG